MCASKGQADQMRACDIRARFALQVPRRLPKKAAAGGGKGGGGLQ